MDAHDTGPGQLVRTKSGKSGKLYNNAEWRNGKVCVRLHDGGINLCDPATLQVYGYFD